MRLWTADGDQARTTADYVAPGTYTISQLGGMLGAMPGTRQFTLYLEAIAPGQHTITASVDPDGPAGPMCSMTDSVKYASWRVDLDVNDNDILSDACDGVLNYLPGYCDGTPVLSTGTSFGTAQYQGQGMQIHVEGLGPGQGIDSVAFTIISTTTLVGYCENGEPTANLISYPNDYSFAQSDDVTSATGTMVDRPLGFPDYTWVSFWAKDYGGAATVKVDFIVDGVPINDGMLLDVPEDRDNDGIADVWEKAQVAQWNSQYSVAETVSNAFFNAGDDKELAKYEGEGVGKPTHKTAGDSLSVFKEYRGYILDGGYNGFGGGHLRLSAAAKEFMVEVDAMAGVTHMPKDAQGNTDIAAIKTWMNEMVAGMAAPIANYANTGTGVRMYYVVDNTATPHDTFQPLVQMPNLITAYAAQNANSLLTGKGFKHLLLVDYLGTPDTDLMSPGASNAIQGWTMYGVDSGYDFNTKYGTTTVAGYISHELHHLLLKGEAGDDGGGHFNDPNGNGTDFEVDDMSCLLWNYNWPKPHSTLSAAFNLNDTEIVVQNAANFPSQGVVLIDNELIRYTGVTGNKLTGLTRPIWLSNQANHGIGADVVVQDNRAQYMGIKYGKGTIKYIDLT